VHQYEVLASYWLHLHPHHVRRLTWSQWAGYREQLDAIHDAQGGE